MLLRYIAIINYGGDGLTDHDCRPIRRMAMLAEIRYRLRRVMPISCLGLRQNITIFAADAIDAEARQ